MVTMSSLQSTVAIEEIRAGLARKRKTQADLAQHMGMSRTGIYRRLEQNVDFTVTELNKVSDYLGVPLASLLTPSAGESAA